VDKKFVVMPITAQGHGSLLGALQEMIVGSLSALGQTAVIYTNDTDLAGATHLLIPGVGVWGSHELEQILARARVLGIRRILWQMETLPPPHLPKTLATRFLLRKSSHTGGGLLRHADSIALRSLERQTEDMWWNQPTSLPARMYRLPIREARYIKKLWYSGFLDKILVCLETRQEFLKGIGITSCFMPFGYHPVWGRPVPESARDIDVLYIGSPNPRRAALLSELTSTLADKGFSVKVVESSLYGEERNQTIARSKVVLHFRNYPWELPRLRLMMAFASGSLYVTEEFSDTAPFVRDEHFVMAPPAEISPTIIRYLRDDAARLKIATNAARLATQQLDLGRVLLRACE
jgi:hypothetical protein